MKNAVISDEEMVNELLKEMEEEIPEEIKPTEEKEEEVSYSTENGDIDIIWLKDDTNNVSQTPNAPDLYTKTSSPLKLVTWHKSTDGESWEEDSEEETNAKTEKYKYKAGIGTADNVESMWANAKNTVDGVDSYFVWIPRYAYRITYYEDETKTKITGYYDGYGMWNAQNKKVNYELDAGIETVKYEGKSYIVHPAFMKDTGKKDKTGVALEDYGRGGWDKNQTGIWVAKYEMSRTDSSASKSGTAETFRSVARVQSARSISIGNMYDYSLKYDETKASHMMKNSEWGACAYLTHSKYGRNGHEIDINNCNIYITGNGGGSTSASNTSEELNAYNTKTGAKASTTGNIYGVYDMSGGAWEYTAGYNADRIQDMDYGKEMMNSEKKSTQYVTVYSNNTTDNSSKKKVQEVSKIGEGIKEVTSRETSGQAWFSDYSNVVDLYSPFLYRGGSHFFENIAGVFCALNDAGNPLSTNSFRIVLGL